MHMSFLTTRLSAVTEGVRIAIDAVRSNKVRAGLTILGIAVGVFVVVSMSAAVHGINESVAKDFASTGPTTFFVSRYPISFELQVVAEPTAAVGGNCSVAPPVHGGSRGRAA
jgi:putative ABC transport system permease protein